MKVLLDSCLGPAARDALVADGHDVIWAGDWERDPGDEEILKQAHDEGRILITLDKDFGALAMRAGEKRPGIVRRVGFRAVTQGAAAIAVLRDHGAALEQGARATVEPGRVRLRS